MTQAERTIAVLGGGSYNLYALKEIASAGFEMIVIDGNPSAPGFDIADISITADISNDLSVLEALGHLTIDGVLPMNDFAVPTAAAISETRGLPGLSRQTAKLATSKAEMRSRWHDLKIDNPPFVIADSGDEAVAAGGEMDFPLVAKPAVSGGGGRGISIVSTEADLLDAWRRASEASSDSLVVIEGFLPGIELTVEGLVHAGQLVTLAVSDKVRSEGVPHVASRLVYPAAISDAERRSVEELASRAVAALGITDGPVHIEAILTPDGPVLVELGARAGGGHIFAPIVEIVSGVNMPVQAARILTGTPCELELRRSGACVYHLFEPTSGLLTAVKGVTQAQDLDGLEALNINVEPGTRLTSHSDSLSRIGSFVVSGEDRASAIAAADAVCSTVEFVYA